MATDPMLPPSMDSPTISAAQLLVTAVSLWSQQTVEDRPFARKNRSAPLGHQLTVVAGSFMAVHPADTAPGTTAHRSLERGPSGAGSEGFCTITL